MTRPRLPHLSWAALGLATAGVFLAYLGLVPAMAGFLTFLLGAASGLGCLILGGVAAVRARSARPLLATLPGTAALLAAVIFLAPGARVPRINDVSTDLRDPPSFRRIAALPVHRGEDLTYPERFKAQVRAAYPDLVSILLPDPPARTFERALVAAKAMSLWHLEHADRPGRLIEIVATSKLFRFKDDLVIRVLAQGTGSRVDLRSRSRHGQSDLGANAARIRAYTARLLATPLPPE